MSVSTFFIYVRFNCCWIFYKASSAILIFAAFCLVSLIACSIPCHLNLVLCVWILRSYAIQYEYVMLNCTIPLGNWLSCSRICKCHFFPRIFMIWDYAKYRKHVGTHLFFLENRTVITILQWAQRVRKEKSMYSSAVEMLIYAKSSLFCWWMKVTQIGGRLSYVFHCIRRWTCQLSHTHVDIVMNEFVFTQSVWFIKKSSLTFALPRIDIDRWLSTSSSLHKWL